MVYKICKKCNLNKNVDLFKNNKSFNDGKSNICIECSIIKNRECKKCGENKDITNFQLRESGYYRWICYSCKNKKLRNEWNPDEQKTKRERYKQRLKNSNCRNEIIKYGKLKCKSCNEEKELSLFSKNNRMISGYESKCKKCREYINERNKLSYNENKEYFSSANKKWRNENPIKARALALRRDAVRKERIMSTPPDEMLDDVSWKLICEHWNNKCAYCKKEANTLSVEHVVPLSKNGNHSTKNILPSCLSCNSSKRNKLLKEWRNIETIVSTHKEGFEYIIGLIHNYN